jgi:hypothetical protein
MRNPKVALSNFKRLRFGELRSGVMISQRRAAQVGLLAALAIIVTSVGIIASNGGNESATGAAIPSQSINQPSESAQRPVQTTPVSLSAAEDSSPSADMQR